MRTTKNVVGRQHPLSRRGTILPFLMVTIVVMVGFLALAIDLGMLAVAKTQIQQAADLAALTAARTVNGDASNSYNQAAATTNAQNVLTYNTVLAQAITSSQLSLTYGSYDYNQTAQSFSANYPPTSGNPTSAVAATVTSGTMANAFSNVLGQSLLPSLSATAQAVHRPRDIALALDLSTSMRFGTCLGFDWYTSSRGTNNPDTTYPTFGHYSGASSSLLYSGASRTSAWDSYTITPTNSTAATSAYAQTYVNSFYQSAAYASPLVRAFDSYTSADGGNTWSAPSSSASPKLPPSSYASVPGGDVPLFKNGSTTTYATNISDVVGSTTTNPLWELDGYSAYSNGSLDTSNAGYPKVWTQVDYSATGCQFNGYTRGPGYYGKTFFLWPPDPRNGALSNTTTVYNYLTLLGMSTTNATTLSSSWNSMTLSTLQTWLTSKGYTVAGGTAATSVPGSNNKAPIYHAVCRLFNRAYPAGSSNGAFSADWRVRFFGTNDNTKLFNSSGELNLPGGSTFTINYNAILTWIAQTSDPFPAQMRAGRIKYYGTVPTSLTGSWPSYGSTDQRFWAEFIDNVLGLRQTSSGVYQDIDNMTGYGTDFTWGTMVRNTPPSAPPYMGYTDNPARPLLRYWFGPLAMVDYLQNINMIENSIANYVSIQPGDSYEAPIYVAKQAFVAAVNTMETNHPNDWVSVVCYSSPRSSASDTWGRFNCVRAPLGPNYNYATSALLFPFGTLNADGSANNTEVNPYTADPVTGNIPSSDFVDTPRGVGSTCFSMALMLCYNQFVTTLPTDATLRGYVSSSPITFPSGMAGGLGRKGAQKVVIFETDGIPNYTATASLVSGGSYSYYKIRYNMNSSSGSEYPAIASYADNDPTVLNQVNSLVQQLATDYGSSRNPFKLYAIGFGPVFQGSLASQALSTLQTMQYYGGTQSSSATALPSNQIITGTDSQMSSAMIATYTNILQNGVQIALIK